MFLLFQAECLDYMFNIKGTHGLIVLASAPLKGKKEPVRENGAAEFSLMHLWQRSYRDGICRRFLLFRVWFVVVFWVFYLLICLPVLSYKHDF